MSVVIQTSYRGWECKFFFSEEGSVYFNTRGNECVNSSIFEGRERDC